MLQNKMLQEPKDDTAKVLVVFPLWSVLKWLLQLQPSRLHARQEGVQRTKLSQDQCPYISPISIAYVAIPPCKGA